MDVISDKKVNRLVVSHGATRIYELEDKTWLSAEQGTVSWRNNNPGNLKLEFAGSEENSHAHRTKDEALETAKHAYKGVVDLDQHGNVVFENYEAGRAAQMAHILKAHPGHTVEEMIRGYSTPDYSGPVHYDAQAKDIHKVAASEGQDLHGKKIKDMTEKELGALVDGISHFEGWKAGSVTPTPVMTDEQVAALKASHPSAHHEAPTHAPGHAAASHALRQGGHGAAVGALQTDLAALGFTARDGSVIQPDQHFGAKTKEAVEAFQTAHHLNPDGVVGSTTVAAMAEAKAHAQAAPSVPTLLDARHPANGMYEQAHACVAGIDESQGRAPGPHTQNFAGHLTTSALALGMQRIDHVVLSDDASRAWAVQGQLNSPFKQLAEVNVMQAIQTPLSQSSQEAAVHVQNNAQQQVQAQQQQQSQQQDQAQQAAGPSMVR
jgi:peptidoglycan hydrolase-like protein with peptidoglycan-binding domain